MHSIIVQLSSSPISKDDYIHEEDFYNDLHKIDADYVSNYGSGEEREEHVFSAMSCFLPGIFSYDKENKILTRKDDPDYSEIESWWKDIQNRVTELNPLDAIHDRKIARFKIYKALLDFGDDPVRYEIDGDVYRPTEAIETLLLSDNTVWYVGGAVDYHS